MTLRVMSYNVRGCRGLDSRAAPWRIARIIASLEPDLVALQEIFIDRHGDQIDAIAQRVGMSHIFCETVTTGHSRYGHAILSRHPVERSRSERLPGLPLSEPRSALWASARVDGTLVSLCATHLSLDPIERTRQLDALLSNHVIGHDGPLVFGGDLNATPRGRLYRRLSGELCDTWLAQKNPPRRRPGTWPALLPLVTLDYLFVSRHLRVERAWVPSGHEVAIASDHRPVLADLTLPCR